MALWPNFLVSMCSECLNFDQHQIHLSTLALIFRNCTCSVQLGSELYSLEQLFWNPYFARSLMFTHDAMVFKSQLRVTPRNLSGAFQNQILVNKKLARLSVAPCQPSFPRQRDILHYSFGTCSRQPEVTMMARRSTRSGPLETRNLCIAKGISSPLSDGLSFQETCNKQTLQQDKGMLTACRVHCGRDVSSMEQVCC